jgi:uncharacterized protein with HEPN domain
MRGHKIQDKDRLYHIQQAVEFILSQIVALDEHSFYGNEVLKRAVVRDLEVIGEAANGLSTALKEKYSDVPWQQIIATRHRIIHEYFHVNYVTVWGIVQDNLPELSIQIDKILKETA